MNKVPNTYQLTTARGEPDTIAVHPADERPRHSQVICVDLDNTLLRTDLLVENILAILCRNPFLLFLFPLWLLRGKAGFKAELARRFQIKPDLLPCNEAVLQLLEARNQEGFRLWLATASNIALAKAVACRFNLFERVLASNATANLKGSAKLKAIRQVLGDEPFVYIGDSASDVAVWASALTAVGVNISRRTALRLKKLGVPLETMSSRRTSRVKSWIKALRLYQWSKNMLVFVPMLLGHQLQMPRLPLSI